MFVCDRELDGLLRVDLGGPLRTILGTVLTDGEGHALTSAEVLMPRTMLGVARISLLHI